jgi:arabinose-5-phosphate isomerase
MKTQAVQQASDEIIQLARQVVAIEKAGLDKLSQQIGHEFVAAVELIMGCEGHVIVIGMGKSGHIGNKISATLASTGTPAFSVHPGEASHGDLGMITTKDVVIMVSNSGETEEVLTILPVIKRMGVPLISITGNQNSTLARAADVHLHAAVDEEACPLGLAPTTSTTVTLVLGDALAVTLLKLRGFTEEDFARSHPAGALGKKLILRISDVMRSGEAIPQVKSGTALKDGLLEMTRKGLGMTAIVDEGGRVIGIYTDGDLRRSLDEEVDLKKTPIDAVMTPSPVTIQADKLAVEAAQLMEANKIHGLLVVDANDQLIGALNIHDLLKLGVV